MKRKQATVSTSSSPGDPERQIVAGPLSHNPQHTTMESKKTHLTKKTRKVNPQPDMYMVFKKEVKTMSRRRCKSMTRLIAKRLEVLDKPTKDKRERRCRVQNLKRRAGNLKAFDTMIEMVIDESKFFDGILEEHRDALIDELKKKIDLDDLVFSKHTDYSGNAHTWTCNFLNQPFDLYDFPTSSGFGWASRRDSFNDTFRPKTMKQIIAHCTVESDFDVSRVNVKELGTAVIGAYWGCFYEELFDLFI